MEVKKKRKVSKSLGAQVAALRASLHLSQPEFAEKLGVTRSAVSACEIGRIVLAPRALVKLAGMALSDSQRLFFMEQAGLDESTVIYAAETIFNRRSAPADP